MNIISCKNLLQVFEVVEFVPIFRLSSPLMIFPISSYSYIASRSFSILFRTLPYWLHLGTEVLKTSTEPAYWRSLYVAYYCGATSCWHSCHDTQDEDGSSPRFYQSPPSPVGKLPAGAIKWPRPSGYSTISHQYGVISVDSTKPTCFWTHLSLHDYWCKMENPRCTI